MFLRLGTIGFGGPAAHLALMEEEIVRRRGWLSRDEFLDRLAAANLVPGPNSTEMAIHIGHLRAGAAGLIVAGACFILPAALIVTALASLYVKLGSYPRAVSVLYAIKPVILAVVLQALWSLGRVAVRSRGLAVLGAAAFAANLLGLGEIAVLAVAGTLTGAARGLGGRREGGAAASGAAPLAWIGATGTGVAAVAGPAAFGLWPMFLTFLKIGSVLFGSGYVLLAFLRADFVGRLGWLSEKQLLDAIAVGQFTPGPVFTTATFIGYLLAGPSGALVATIGIFLPAFVFVAISGPIVPRLRRSAVAAAALDGVIVGSLAVMAAVTWRLLRVGVVDGTTAALFGVAGFLLLRFRVNSAWLVLAAGMIGAALGGLR